MPINGLMDDFVPPTPRPVRTMVIDRPATPVLWFNTDGSEVINCTNVPQTYRLYAMRYHNICRDLLKESYLRLMQSALYRPINASDRRAKGIGVK